MPLALSLREAEGVWFGCAEFPWLPLLQARHPTSKPLPESDPRSDPALARNEEITCFLPVIEATTTASPTRLPGSSHSRHPIFQRLLLNGHPQAEFRLGQSSGVGAAESSGAEPS